MVDSDIANVYARVRFPYPAPILYPARQLVWPIVLQTIEWGAKPQQDASLMQS